MLELGDQRAALVAGAIAGGPTYLTASRRLGHESLLARAREHGAAIVRAAARRQRFVMPQATYSPSLYVGTAGIG